MNPGSKKYTLDNKDFFFEPFNGFSLDDLYNSLDIIADNQEELQQWIYEHSKKICDAHFATCFLALVLIRLLENKLGHSFPLPRILESLKKYKCTHIDSNNWRFTYYDEIIEARGKAFDMKLDMKYRSQQEIQRLLHY